MSGEIWKKRSAFELGVLALTAVTLLLMVGWFAFGSVRLSDGWRVEVERNDDPPVSVSADTEEWPDSLLEGEVIDLNNASAADLKRLPGIGDTRAQAVVEHRRENGPFESVDDLVRVDGIGPGILEQLRPYVTVG